MPLDLASAETSALRSLSPRRNRWPEVAAFDERVTEFRQRQAEINAELADLRERLRTAPAADTEALAEWQLDGQKEPRPEPQVPALEEAIARLEADFAGAEAAVAQVLEQKERYVEKHRKRLVREADRRTEEKHAERNHLLERVAETRQELADLRAATVWASLYPAREAGQTVRDQLLAGGLRQPVERTLAITSQVQFDAVIAALKADAAWLRCSDGWLGARRRGYRGVSEPASPFSFLGRRRPPRPNALVEVGSK